MSNNGSPSLFEFETPQSNESGNGDAFELDQNIGLNKRLVQQNPSTYSRNGVRISYGDVSSLYQHWESPVAIISDGPYGVKGYPGDPPKPDRLGEWYEPHIVEWSRKATPLTTIWFWNTEVGWANVHPVLVKNGWEYRGASVWDKGIAHIAGNINTGTIRRIPPITELCVHYTREATFQAGGERASMKEWLRREWTRSGIPLYRTNEACGVINAATRKYFTQCHLWYFPPAEMFAKLCDYANKHGKPEGRPYFSIDGKRPLSGAEWENMRAKFRLDHGVTNVWRHPAVRNDERLKSGLKAIHTNQKPLQLVEMTIKFCTDAGDMVWEPFGGLCTGAVASLRLGRRCEAAEIDPDFYGLAISRVAICDHRAASDCRLR
jgi:DNA modification methylase